MRIRGRLCPPLGLGLALGLVWSSGCVAPATEPSGVETKSAPSSEAKPPRESRLSQLQIQDAYACVVADQREVLCWGQGVEQPTTTAAEERIAKPIDLGQGRGPDAPKVVHLWLGWREVCALFDDHRRRCLRLDRPDEPPTSEATAEGVVKVANRGERAKGPPRCVLDAEHLLLCGDQTAIEVLDFVTEAGGASCAIREAGWVRCWGGSVTAEYYKQPVGPVEGGVAIVDGHRPCVLTKSGEAWCRELDRVLYPDGVPPEGALRGGEFVRVPSSSGEPILDLDRTFEHMCALERGGRVWCRGHNGAGQLGAGDTQLHMAEVEVALPGPASEIAVGETQSCAIVANQVLCWGQHRTDAHERALVELETRALHLSPNLSCATTAPGQLQCWGRLGRWRQDVVAEPRPRVAVSALGPVDAFIAGYGEAAMLLSQGELAHGEGLLVYDGSTTAKTPEIDWSRSKVESFLLSPRALCALDGASQLLCWTEKESSALVPQYGRIEGMPPRSGVTAMYADMDQVCAVSRGKLACASTSSEAPGWRSVPGLGRVVAVAGDEDRSTCAVLEDGGVKCWRGQHRRKGLELVTPPFALELDGARDLVVGSFGVCVMTEAGAVHCGEDGATQLEVEIAAGAVEIAASVSHWCARLDLDADGRSEAVECHGDNDSGQLGQLGGHVMLEPTPIELALAD